MLLLVENNGNAAGRAKKDGFREVTNPPAGPNKMKDRTRTMNFIYILRARK
jgi:hypothetical protein